jgi:lysophospholipase L1-like esterase
MKLFLSLLAATLAAAAAPPPRASQALPVHVGGRVIHERGGALAFGWPGVYFEARFRGSGVRVRLDAGEESLRLLVDGEEKARFERAGSVDAAFTGLGRGEHRVRLEKLTESQTGGARFLGFYAAAGGTALPPPRRARQIEFIGDSFTAGYGNTSPVRECTKREVHDLTDTQQAYGPLVARHYDADYRVIAYSGFGIVRNYAGGSPGLSLPRIYERLKPDDPERLEKADPRWRPQLIVVKLGTNDFSTPLRTGERWADAEALRADFRRTYLQFLAMLRARQPQAQFILMGEDEFFPELERIAAAVNGQKPGLTTTLRYGALERTGCDWHPSLADNRKIAGQLIAAIDRLGGAWAPVDRPRLSP